MDYNEIKKIIKTGMSNGKEVSAEDRKKIKKELNSARKIVALESGAAVISACGLSFVENSIIEEKSDLSQSIDYLEKELNDIETLRLNGQISDEEYEEQKKMINKKLKRMKIRYFARSTLLSFSNGVMAGIIITPDVLKTIDDSNKNI